MIGFNSFNSLFELLEAFPTEQSCIEYLKKVRWGEKVKSPFSPGSKVYVCGNNTYLCKDTGRRFNVKREPFLRILKCRCENGLWLYGWFFQTRKEYHLYSWRETLKLLRKQPGMCYNG